MGNVNLLLDVTQTVNSAHLELLKTKHLDNAAHAVLVVHLVPVLIVYNVKEVITSITTNALLALFNAKLSMGIIDVLNVQLDLLNKLYPWIVMFQVLFTVITASHVILIVKHVKFNQKDVHHAMMV